MTIRWADYQYCEEFSFLEAAFLWLEIEPDHNPKSEPPVRVRGLKDKIKKFVKPKRWEELLSKVDNQEKFIFDQVLEIRKREIYPWFGFEPLSICDGPEEDRPLDNRSKEERWKIAKKKPCSAAEREGVLAQMPWPEDHVTREELVCFAESLGEKPKFLFSENESGDGWEKGETSKSSYQKLIKILAHALNIDLTHSEAGGVIQVKAGLAKIKISEPTVLKILDEIHPSRLKNSNRRAKRTN
jgi:hypothetical protein